MLSSHFNYGVETLKHCLKQQDPFDVQGPVEVDLPRLEEGAALCVSIYHLYAHTKAFQIP